MEQRRVTTQIVTPASLADCGITIIDCSGFPGFPGNNATAEVYNNELKGAAFTVGGTNLVYRGISSSNMYAAHLRAMHNSIDMPAQPIVTPDTANCCFAIGQIYGNTSGQTLTFLNNIVRLRQPGGYAIRRNNMNVTSAPLVPNAAVSVPWRLW